jgi:Txe/YoeB family toxin of toxin-antitoxin system
LYKILRTKQAQKGAEICERTKFKARLDEILDTVERAPYELSQGFERLTGNMNGACSRRISHHNRFVYTVLPNNDGAVD